MTNGGRPNLLYILSDQHSPYVAGCYGDIVVRTPHLDSLAASGVMLTSAYCPSPICVPSRMSMLTGRHPFQNQVWTNHHILDSATPTFAHALGAAGYRPMLIGRLHSIGPDQLRGYTQRLVGDHTPNHVGGPACDRGYLDRTAGPDRISLKRSGHGQSAYQVHDEDVVATAVDYLRQLGEERNGRTDVEPFALSVGLMLPHQPFVARQEDYSVYDGRVPPPHSPPLPDSELHSYLRWWRRHTGIEEVGSEEVRRSRTAYWALVARMDALIGRILTALHESGLAEDTMIVYLSDHGEQAGEHGLWWKQTYYEASVRIPALISWPGVIPAGQRCDRVIGAVDITATVLDACGAPQLPNAAGRSFLDLLRWPNRDTAWRDETFSEYCTDIGWITRMVRSGPWKLNYYHGHRPQLFNLDVDPDERNDLATDPSHADVRTSLLDRLLADWDPDDIASRMAQKRADNALLRTWAQNTQPSDQYRWDLRPEMNWLDLVTGPRTGESRR